MDRQGVARPSAAPTRTAPDGRRTWVSVATVAGWHAAAAAAVVGWVLTWPSVVGTGGDVGFGMSRWLLALLLLALVGYAVASD